MSIKQIDPELALEHISNAASLRELSVFFSFERKILVECYALELDGIDFNLISCISVDEDFVGVDNFNASDHERHAVDAYICDSADEYRAKLIELMSAYESAA